MLAKSNETLPQTRDSFFDEDDDEEDGNPPSSELRGISSIRIVTSKPPVYRRKSHSSNSPSPSSCCSDRDVTDVSSLGGGDHHQVRQQQQQKPAQPKTNHERHHSFHLQNMRHVLLGSSAPTSRPPSPADPSQQLNKKHVRIVTDESETNHQTHSNHHHHHHHQQPYIHGHTRDYRRVRLTSSAINRQKQQQKIERENLRILERLQHTRATNSLKRDELLSNYDQQMGYVSYGTPPNPPRLRLPSRPSSVATMHSTYTISEKKSTNQSRPSSASQPINSNSMRSRPGSAPTSIHGSSRSSSARRPTWNDRWQQHE